MISDKCGCFGLLEVWEVNFYIYDFFIGLIFFEFLGFNCFFIKIIFYWFKNSVYKFDVFLLLLFCCVFLIVFDVLLINLIVLMLNYLKIFFRML